MLQQMLLGLPAGEMTPEDAASMKQAMALYGLGSVFKGDDASPTLQSMMMMDMARSKNAKEEAERRRIQSEIGSIWGNPMTQQSGTPAKNSYGLDMGRSTLPKGNTTTVGGTTYDMGRPAGSDYASAISTVESGGRYDAIGPVTKNGNRAYGKYQVMDFNIGPWTEKHLGRRMTPQEFLADPEAQDAVFNAEFGSYVDRYGNPQDAASMWFSGRPMAQAGNASDGYTTVPEYVAKFTGALGQPGQQARPAQSSDFSFGNVSGQQFQGALLPFLQQQQAQNRQQPSQGVRVAQSGTDWRQIALNIRNSNLPPEEKQRQFQQLRLMMDIEKSQKPEDRKTAQDAAGRLRYVDSGEYVFPDVEVPVDQPSSVREYEYAKANGYTGSYNDFLDAKGKSSATNVSTTVNTGDQPDARPMADKPAKGYQRRWDPERGTWVDEPIPGGEVERENQAAAEASGKVQQRKKTTATVVLDDISRIRKIVNNDTEIPLFGSTTTGLAGGLLSRVDSTQAGAVRNMLDTIRSNIGFDKLQSMREESPTGGAVGQVSNLENRLMQATFGALVQSQSKEQFLYNLERVEKIYDRIINEGISDQEAENLLVGLGGAASDPLGIR